MVPETTYISLGISPDAAGIVMQPVLFNGDPHFSSVVSFADIDNRFMGMLLLTGLKAYFPVIRTLADSLIPKDHKSAPTYIPDHSGSKRDLHLRIYVMSDAVRLVIRRFQNDDACGDDPYPVMLEPLMEDGPRAVADYVGSVILSELAKMHPEVFAALPALMGGATG